LAVSFRITDPENKTEDLAAVGRLPAPTDNVAIAVRRLEAGTAVRIGGAVRRLEHTVLEGHRFAVRAIAPGEPLLSWGEPFGRALAAISPGEYVCNASVLEALAVRRLGAALPSLPNFADEIVPFRLDEASFRPGAPVPQEDDRRTFLGYERPGRRGTGTRNCIVILGTTSRTASFARLLADRLRPLARVSGCDGIVAVAHTEGGGPGEPNNSAEILRALAGFIVHPNVAAVLAVDIGTEPVGNARLKKFMGDRGYPLADVPHEFLSMGGGLASALAEGERIVRRWLPEVAAMRRSEAPISGLRVALQCGGSDAFSGVSGNPLAGAMVHEVVRRGGSANLCETDELVGAEGYVLQNVADLPTARRLLGMIEAFKRRLGWHGVTPEGNPSGGNKLRGLYNIVLKSLGATHKKDPRTRIEAVIRYAEPMTVPGFNFMDSPGNDLEGIAGQVGAGCNLILFVTGNGSITNFPFVPTLKVTTTTRRHELLAKEMDINAGRYLDGEPMEKLVAESFELLIATASGRLAQGERAGHAQVSLWRNWRQTDASRLEELRARAVPDGRPLPLAPGAGEAVASPARIDAFRTPGGAWATERVGLVLPTSLCAAQIAVLAAERLQAAGAGRASGVPRFVALAHTEGCGFSGESMYRLLHRSYRGYATHPNVAAALLLEHGCEKIPNDAMRREFEKKGVPLDRFGWASVQLDGGIEKAIARIEAWFAEKLAASPGSSAEDTDLGALSIGLLTAEPADPRTAAALAAFTRAVVGAGGSILLAESDPLLANPEFRGPVLGSAPPRATLAYGEPLGVPGLHLVETETDHWVENLAGLGACGAHLFLGVVSGHSRQGHPLLPLIQVAAPRDLGSIAAEDIDAFLSGVPDADARLLLQLVADVASRRLTTRTTAGKFDDFQLTRGLLGVST